MLQPAEVDDIDNCVLYFPVSVAGSLWTYDNVCISMHNTCS